MENLGVIKSVDSAIIKQSIWPLTITSSVRSAHHRSGDLFVLFGSISALNGTPSSSPSNQSLLLHDFYCRNQTRMIGYGLAKVVVHQLTTSLAQPKSWMPPDSHVIALLLHSS
ncbi:Dihydropteridine reductase [Taenia crassiceps]|uniref:Dihydropteridine reductase n=1 Tax=Taenia crassiceps TaxID=6207 RepID=A0ABR4QQ32_9CEST